MSVPPVRESRLGFWLRHLAQRHAARERRLGRWPAAPRWCGVADDYITRDIAITGRYEGASLDTIAALVDAGRIAARDTAFLDVGANIGVFTLALAPRFAQVIAVEPQGFVGEILALNVRAAGAANVRIAAVALGAAPGELVLDAGSAGNLGRVGAARAGIAGERVEVRTGDALVQSEAGPRIGFIKVDVEGAEAEVLAGLATTLRRDRPVVAFEANDRDASAKVVALLRASDYDEFLGLDYRPRVRNKALRVLVQTLLGPRQALAPYRPGDTCSLVFAWPARANAASTNSQDTAA